MDTTEAARQYQLAMEYERITREHFTDILSAGDIRAQAAAETAAAGRQLVDALDRAWLARIGAAA